MAYRAVGTDLVVSSLDAPAARARVLAIVKSNEQKKAAYQKALVQYQAAVAARAAIEAAIAQDQVAYKNAMLSYNAKVASITGAASSARQGYNAGLAQWQAAKDAYNQAVTYHTQMLAQQKGRSDAVLAKVTPPSGYQGCVSQADHDAYVKRCQAVPNTTVKGLGQMLFGLSGDSAECLWANLPICVSLPALPPDPGPPPKAPIPPSLPSQPKAPPARKVPAVPQRPMMPVLEVEPTLIVTPDAPPMTAMPTAPASPDDEPKSFVVAGLLAVVIVGGGAAYYYHSRKKKVA